MKRKLKRIKTHSYDAITFLLFIPIIAFVIWLYMFLLKQNSTTVISIMLRIETFLLLFGGVSKIIYIQNKNTFFKHLYSLDKNINLESIKSYLTDNNKTILEKSLERKDVFLKELEDFIGILDKTKRRKIMIKNFKYLENQSLSEYLLVDQMTSTEEEEKKWIRIYNDYIKEFLYIFQSKNVRFFNKLENYNFIANILTFIISMFSIFFIAILLGLFVFN